MRNVWFQNLIHSIVLIAFVSEKVQAAPHVCTIVNTPIFQSCLKLEIAPDMCGWPIPRPCARISYYVPETFIEVVSNSKETFFSDFPGVQTQLTTLKSDLPFGTEDDNGSFSFHAHTITVPYVTIPFSLLPCGGAPIPQFCFGAMSEHLGSLWKTGDADRLQPNYLAWAISPKACLLKGAVSSLSGGSTPSNYQGYGMCSMDRSYLTKFPPTNQPVCTGWGIFFPRYGTVTNSDQTTASLMVALRMKSLGTEVFQSVRSDADEQWQMVYPQASSCFREGQNVGILQGLGVNELGRLTSGKLKNYLYTTWKRVSCTRDLPYVPEVYAGVELMGAVCKGIP